MKTICNKNEDTQNQNKTEKIREKIHGQMMWVDANEHQWARGLGYLNSDSISTACTLYSTSSTLSNTVKPHSVGLIYFSTRSPSLLLLLTLPWMYFMITDNIWCFWDAVMLSSACRWSAFMEKTNNFLEFVSDGHFYLRTFTEFYITSSDSRYAYLNFKSQTDFLAPCVHRGRTWTDQFRSVGRGKIVYLVCD